MKRNDIFTEVNAKILAIKVGDLVWNIGGVCEIVEIYAKGISAVDNAAYCCFYTKFGEDSRMSGSVRADRFIEKDGYYGDKSILQFIPNSVAAESLAKLAVK